MDSATGGSFLAIVNKLNPNRVRLFIEKINLISKLSQTIQEIYSNGYSRLKRSKQLDNINLAQFKKNDA